MGRDFAKVRVVPGKRPAWSRVVGPRAVLPLAALLAALLAATMLAGCVVAPGYRRDYPRYSTPDYRPAPDYRTVPGAGPPRVYDNRNDVRPWPDPNRR